MLVLFGTISSTQSEPAYCGVTTLVIVLNALSVDPRRVWKGPWRWYEESMLNCCMDMEEIKKTGITMGVFVCLSKCQGLAVDPTLASDSSRDEFRQAVRLACVKNMDDEAGEMQGEEISSRHTFLVVSYSRAALKQTGSGHFPLWLPMMRHRIPS
jgi:glutathione gamma-glutamylcysteinyltransferase